MKNVMLVQPDLDLDRSFENVNEFFAGMFGVLHLPRSEVLP